MANGDRISFNCAQDSGVFIRHDLDGSEPVLPCRPDASIAAKSVGLKSELSLFSVRCDG